ncbi:pathogenesis-related protein 1a [Phtheirospermum japonicum]|uniref:Pathogenesis-related protein 1a n=1 Tax=Phtheirospermum japonicum TaxID=374723 RepID=A0A830CMF3_9LAMI|nr:pathogenesis-related protein 1a [Phtheirospermum japonicum]
MANYQVPDNSQHEFLETHNEVRANVTKETNIYLPPLVWNHTVASYAWSYAHNRSKDCDMVHSEGPYGENLTEGNPFSATDAVKFWASEKSDYNYEHNSCADGQVCGHYTQIVWKSSTQLGCARLQCTNGMFFMICNYYPPGNYGGERPY